MDRLSFEGQVAIVTGGARGLGLAYASELARRGAKIVVCDSGVTQDGFDPDPAVAKAAAEMIVTAGGEAIAQACDVTETDQVEGMIARTVERFGKVDILISNAAIHNMIAFPDCDVEDFARSVRIDAIGSFNVARAVWPHMAACRYGRIVFMTSSAMFGNPSHLLHYSTGKGAVTALGRSVALTAIEQKLDNVRVNTVAPFGYSRMVYDNPKLSEAEKGVRRTFGQPNKTAQFVAALVHPSNVAHGQFFSAGAGRFTRLLMAETEGFFDAELTAESAASHMQAVLEQQGVRYVASSKEHLNGFYSNIPGWDAYLENFS